MNHFPLRSAAMPPPRLSSSMRAFGNGGDKCAGRFTTIDIEAAGDERRRMLDSLAGARRVAGIGWRGRSVGGCTLLYTLRL